MFQKQVAQQIGVDATTVWNWERNATSPQVHDMPRIIEFLGYNPLPEPATEPEKLIAARRALGLTQKAMAQKIGIDPATLGRAERGKIRRLFAKTRRKLAPLKFASAGD